MVETFSTGARRRAFTSDTSSSGAAKLSTELIIAVHLTRYRNSHWQAALTSTSQEARSAKRRIDLSMKDQFLRGNYTPNLSISGWEERF